MVDNADRKRLDAILSAIEMSPTQLAAAGYSTVNIGGSSSSSSSTDTLSSPLSSSFLSERNLVSSLQWAYEQICGRIVNEEQTLKLARILNLNETIRGLSSVRRCEMLSMRVEAIRREVSKLSRNSNGGRRQGGSDSRTAGPPAPMVDNAQIDAGLTNGEVLYLFHLVTDACPKHDDQQMTTTTTTTNAVQCARTSVQQLIQRQLPKSTTPTSRNRLMSLILFVMMLVMMVNPVAAAQQQAEDRLQQQRQQQLGYDAAGGITTGSGGGVDDNSYSSWVYNSAVNYGLPLITALLGPPPLDAVEWGRVSSLQQYQQPPSTMTVAAQKRPTELDRIVMELQKRNQQQPHGSTTTTTPTDDAATTTTTTVAAQLLQSGESAKKQQQDASSSSAASYNVTAPTAAAEAVPTPPTAETKQQQQEVEVYRAGPFAALWRNSGGGVMIMDMVRRVGEFGTAGVDAMEKVFNMAAQGHIMLFGTTTTTTIREAVPVAQALIKAYRQQLTLAPPYVRDSTAIQNATASMQANMDAVNRFLADSGVQIASIATTAAPVATATKVSRKNDRGGGVQISNNPVLRGDTLTIPEGASYVIDSNESLVIGDADDPVAPTTNVFTKNPLLALATAVMTALFAIRYLQQQPPPRRKSAQIEVVTSPMKQSKVTGVNALLLAAPTTTTTNGGGCNPKASAAENPMQRRWQIMQECRNASLRERLLAMYPPKQTILRRVGQFFER